MDLLCGICGNRVWAWKVFTRGQHPIVMDGYDGAAYGSGGAGFEMQDPTWVSLRENLGHIRRLADDLAEDGRMAPLAPMSEMCSTGYCLAGGDAAAYTVVGFIPNGRSIDVNLTQAGTTRREYKIQWLDTTDGQWTDFETVTLDGVAHLSRSDVGDWAFVLRSAPGSEPGPTPSRSSPEPRSTSAPGVHGDLSALAIQLPER